jgi:hypothetical protein
LPTCCRAKAIAPATAWFGTVIAVVPGWQDACGPGCAAVTVKPPPAYTPAQCSTA